MFIFRWVELDVVDRDKITAYFHEDCINRKTSVQLLRVFHSSDVALIISEKHDLRNFDNYS